MKSFTLVRFILLTLVAIFFSSCGGKGGHTGNQSLTSIIVNVNANKILSGTQIKANATGIYSDGSTLDLTKIATWNSSNPAAVSVESDGTITGNLASAVEITASYQGITSSVSLDTVDVSLATVSVSVSDSLLPLNTQAHAKAIAYSGEQNSQDISTQVNWASSDDKVLTVDSNGVITTHAVGSATVTAEFNGYVSNEVKVTVTSASLISIGVSTNNNLIHEGSSSSVTAIGYFSDGAQMDLTSQVSWSSSDQHVLDVASLGRVIGHNEGSALLFATLNNVTSNHLSFTVKKVKLENITIYLSDNKVSAGTSVKATATGMYSDGSTADLTSDVVWSSSDSSVANIAKSGEIVANKSGLSTIKAFFAGVNSNSLVFIVSSATLTNISIHVPDSNIPVGLKISAVATGFYSDGTEQDLSSQVFWGSSNDGVVNIDSGGVISGNKVGTTNITASFGSITSHVLVFSVRDATLKSIAINVDDNSIPVGTKINVTAKGYYSDDTTEDLTAQVKWSSSDDSVASVDKNGVVTGNKEGQTNLVASLNGLDSNDLPVIVSAAKLQDLVINLDSASIASGASTNATATGYYSDGTQQDLTKVVAWTSTDNQVANIDSIGEIKSLKVGSVSIYATYAGKTSTHLSLNITDAVLKNIVVNLNDNNVASGLSAYATAEGYYSDGTQNNITNQVDWTSSDNSIANIGNNGEVSAIKAGVVTIKASLNGVLSNEVSFTVASAKLKSIDVTLSANNIPDGTEVQAIAMGNYTNGDRTDITKQVNWSSTDGSIANISSNGLIVANKVGNVIIKAGFGDINSDGHTLIVVNAELQSIVITTVDKSISIPAGSSTQLQAIGHYSNGQTEDLTKLVNWSSASNDVLNVTTDGKIIGGNPGNTSITAKFNSISSNSLPFTVSSAVLKSIAININDNNIPRGMSSQLTATGTYSDNSTKNLTAQVAWTSSSTSTANIDAQGLVTGVNVGTSNIQASLGEVASTPLSVVVTSAKLTGILVSLNSSNIPNGTNTQALAKGSYSDGTNSDITSQVSWKSGSEMVASIDSKGVISGASVGVSLISASLGEVSSNQQQLAVTAAKLTGITINVADSNLAKGNQTTATAKGSYTDGRNNVDITDQVVWSSTSPSTVSVTNGKSPSTVSGSNIGASAISASLSGVNSSSISVNVTAAVLNSITVKVPDNEPYVGETNQATATGYYSDGSNKDLTAQVLWKLSGAPLSTPEDLVTLTADGKYTIKKNYAPWVDPQIYAQLNGVTSNKVAIGAFANRMEGLSIGISDNSIAAGTSATLSAKLRFADGKQKDLSVGSVDWVSSSPSTISISSNGDITAYKAGTVTINASYDSWLYFGDRVNADPIIVTVSGRSLQSITINASTSNIAKGSSIKATATGYYYDATSQDLTNQVSWSSNDNAIASVDVDGTIKGNNAGSTQISAKFNNVTSNLLTATVTPATLNSITLSLDTLKIAAGTETIAHVEGHYSDSTHQDITNQVSFISTDSSVADVTPSGIVKSYKIGSAVLKAKYGEINSNTQSLEVTSAILKSIEILPVETTIAAGTTTNVKAVGVYSDGDRQDMTNQVSWLSSDDAVGYVNSSGIMQANKVGTFNIVAKYGSTSSSNVTITVSAAKLKSIKLKADNTNVIAGTEVQLSAVGVYSDGSEQDLSNQISWLSSDNTIANISATGKLFGEKAGSVNITASLSGITSDSLSITVTGNYLKSLKIELGSYSVASGLSTTMKLVGTYSDGEQRNITSGFSNLTCDYLMVNCNIYDGIITASSYRTGSTSFSVKVGNITSNTVVFNVTPAVLTGISLEVPNCLAYFDYQQNPSGDVGYVKVIGKLSDGNTNTISVDKVSFSGYSYYGVSHPDYTKLLSFDSSGKITPNGLTGTYGMTAVYNGFTSSNVGTIANQCAKF